MKLTHLFTLAAVLLSGAFFGSCDTSATNEHHETYFYPMLPEGKVWFADQRIDSLLVVSYDSWKLTERFPDEDQWFDVSPDKQEIPAGYFASTVLRFSISPNTTEKIRKGSIEVVTTFAQFGTMVMPARQMPYLNILRPIRLNPEKPNMPDFGEKLSAKGGTSLLSFVLYDSDAASHSLVSDADWLIVPTESAQPGEGKHSVELRVLENSATTPRTAHITLTSAGVSTVITYEQQGKSAS